MRGVVGGKVEEVQGVREEKVQGVRGVVGEKVEEVQGVREEEEQGLRGLVGGKVEEVQGVREGVRAVVSEWVGEVTWAEVRVVVAKGVVVIGEEVMLVTAEVGVRGEEAVVVKGEEEAVVREEEVQGVRGVVGEKVEEVRVVVTGKEVVKGAGVEAEVVKGAGVEVMVVGVALGGEDVEVVGMVVRVAPVVESMWRGLCW